MHTDFGRTFIDALRQTPSSTKNALTATRKAKIDAVLSKAIPAIKGGQPIDAAIFAAGGDEGIKEVEREAAAGAPGSIYFLAQLKAAGVYPPASVAATSVGVMALPFILIGGGILLWMMLKK